MFVASIPPPSRPPSITKQSILSTKEAGFESLTVTHQGVETNKPITASGSALDKERYLASEGPPAGVCDSVFDT